MKLKELLLESKDKAALEFLSSLVKDGPYKDRVFLAGGAVRDMELGKIPKDLDVVVKGDISAGIDFAVWATKKMGNFKDGSNPVIFPTYGTSKFNLTGVTYKGYDLSDVDVEAVAPRKEKYSDNSRKPEVSGGELSDDVNRRDFTVNSLLKDLTSGEILDLTGKGRDDIKAGIIRTPLNPDVIFSEDPLRILRAVRFSAKYKWKLPLFMIRSITKNGSKLNNISRERIKDELDKMMMTDNPDKAMKLMKITGIYKYVFDDFPELFKGLSVNFKANDTKNTPANLVSRLSTFLASTDLPTMDVVNKIEKVMIKLKYPTFIINSVKNVVKHFKDLNPNNSDKELRRTLLFLKADLSNAIEVAHSKILSKDTGVNINNFKDRLDTLNLDVKHLKLPIDGNDLISLNIKPGPKFKEIMDKILDSYLENPKLSREDAIKISKTFL